MIKGLLIAEKKSVADSISQVYERLKPSLGYELDITYSNGHIFGLLEPDDYKEEWGSPWNENVLPIIPDVWQTKILNDERYSCIKTLYLSNSYSFIINAGDTDREGQLIQEMIYSYLGIYDKNGETVIPIYRFLINDTTPESIKAAFFNMKPNSDYLNVARAGYLRLYIDWLIGMNLSRAASIYTSRNIYIGRVLTAVLSLVCSREVEYNEFTPEVYTEIKASFLQLSGYSYIGTLLNSDNQSLRFNDKKDKDIKRIIKGLPDKGTIIKIESKEIVTKPPLLLNLLDLQKKCFDLYGYTPSSTLDLAQSLYEKKLITYPRTNSRHLFPEQRNAFSNQLKAASSIPGLKGVIDGILQAQCSFINTLESERYVNNDPDSHAAITVTAFSPDLSSLTKDELNVYTVIAYSMVSIFLPDNRKKATSIITKVGDHHFLSTVSYTIEQGWEQLYKELTGEDITLGKTLDGMYEGDEVSIITFHPLTKNTSSPKRYTYSTILDAMQNSSGVELGTPATRGEILNKLIKYHYIKMNGRKKRTIVPTEEGMVVYNTLNCLKQQKLTDPDFSSQLERRLSLVEKGKEEFNTVYNDMVQFISDEIPRYKKLPILQPNEADAGVCPQCLSSRVIYGGDYAYCQGVKENSCDFSIPLNICGAKISLYNIKNLVEHGRTENITFSVDGNVCNNILKLITLENKSVCGRNKISLSFGSLEDRVNLGTCPKCHNGFVSEEPYYYYCASNNGSHCDLKIDKRLGNKTISPSMMQEILEYGYTIEPLKVKLPGASASITSRICLNDKYIPVPVPFESKDLFKCPNCIDGIIQTFRYGYRCSNYSVGNCKISIPYSFLGSSISEADAYGLLTNNSIRKKITFKNGNSAIKLIKLVEDKENKRYMLRF